MEQETADFVAAIDVYTQEQTKKLLSVLEGLKVISFTKLIDVPSDVFEKFGLNSDILIGITRELDGNFQATYYYKGMEMNPEAVDFMNYEDVGILSMLKECIRQDTCTPKLGSVAREAQCEYCGTTENVSPNPCEKETDSEHDICQDCVDNHVGDDDGCICKGNWRLIIKEYSPLFGRRYLRDRDKVEYEFFGVVWEVDDLYYGMHSDDAKYVFLSCVGDIENQGFTLLPEVTHEGQECDYCGSTENVTVTTDPYSKEIEDDLTELPLCQDCIDRRAEEI